MKEQLYTIGQMASICSLSIQTLRYYDKINLIKPSLVDKLTGYRYYSDQDIRYLGIIQDMKKIGFSLDDIRTCFQGNNNHDTLKMLEKKQKEYADKLRATHATLDRITNRLKNLERQEKAAESLPDFARTIEIKHVPDRTVVFDRKMSGSSHDVLAKRFFELDNLTENEGFLAIDSRIAIYHDFLEEHDPSNCDLEVCVPIQFRNEISDLIRIIPGGSYATGIYKGKYYGQCSYLIQWISDNGYQITGPGIEVYLNSFLNTPFPENYITEVQFPVIRSNTT